MVFPSLRSLPFRAACVPCCLLLLAGCFVPEPDDPDSFTFTQQDVARFRALAEDTEERFAGSGAVPVLDVSIGESGSGSAAALDLSTATRYQTIRAGSAVFDRNIFRVTNGFLNVRAEPSASAALLERLERGDLVEVAAFVNGEWAKIKSGEREGYVSIRFIGRIVGEDQLEAERRKYEGQQYVRYSYVNMRSAPDQSSEKIAEVPGLTILRPARIENGWAEITWDGKTGYVSADYLQPFLPTFLVRQMRYELPILLYRLTDEQSLLSLSRHIAALKQAGKRFMTLREVGEIIQEQEQQNVRLEPGAVVIGIAGIDADTVNAVSNMLNAQGMDATLFIESSRLGLSGITEQTILTLMANGFDIASGTHTGVDLRALTNAQAEAELLQSRQLLEDYTGRTVDAVAYPLGGVNDRILQIAEETGYLFGVAGGNETAFARDELLHLPAIHVAPTATAEEVVRLVEGSSVSE